MYTLESGAVLRADRRAAYAAFLARRGLVDEGGASFYVLLLDGREEIVATGALRSNVLCQIAVAGEAEGEGACAAVVSALLSEANARGLRHLFLYTTPARVRVFASMGFYPVVQTPDAAMLENMRGGLDRFLTALPHPGGHVGAVVMHANPFTLGHRYLVERAAAVCDAVQVFVLSEPGAMFSPETRLRLVREGTADLPGVFVSAGGAYLISRATLPTYFIKERAHIETVRADLDIALFGTRIAPALGISERFVGEEPFCPVTRAYNAALRALLPGMGVAVTELPRLGDISASRVRALIEAGNLEAVRPLVPEGTMTAILEGEWSR